jgi:hypothetical protein
LTGRLLQHVPRKGLNIVRSYVSLRAGSSPR